ncbi:MAG: 16S rRNA (cytidine(1402)-2'-O)-methyltransferase [Deltaproteobacteria bacterium]|nr:16S rRNA (cytidine(1402)-2'-O)-methyltransferase [Deltaproteobacteria bacterium]
MSEEGCLYICATPIGNIADVSSRLVEVLSSVDLIAAEDTRVARMLLSHLQIKFPEIISCFEGNEVKRSHEICDLIETGKKIALISDAGTPAISDPGYIIVREIINRGLKYAVIPGPSALTAALCGSGLDSSHFHFEGFLPPKSGERQKRLKQISGIGETIVLYESPHRIEKTVTDIVSVFHPDTKITIGRELTKLYEEFIHCKCSELNYTLSGITKKGEFVIIIENKQQQTQNILPPLNNQVIKFLESGVSPKTISSLLVDFYDVSKREIYQKCLEFIKEN